MTPVPRTIADVARAVRSGETTAAAEVEMARAACLQRNEALGAFVALDWAAAGRQAQVVDSAVARGEDPGPLAGVPFGVKDLQHAAGFVTACGSRLHAEDEPARRDSPIVRRLRAAGAIAVGKTATAEFGMDSATTTPAFGTARNPYDLRLTPGGSSGGSAAAVAAGLVAFATGSDEGGSIRSPASFCGIVGLKPTHGLVPRDDGLSDTNTVGVLTRTVADTALLLDVVAGADPQDKMSAVVARPSTSYLEAMRSTRLSGLRACWSADLGHAVADPAIVERARLAAFDLAQMCGIRLEEPDIRFEPAPDIWMTVVSARFVQKLSTSGFLPDRVGELGPAAAAFVEFGRGVTAADLAAAEHRREVLEDQVGAFFGRYDLLMTPTVACDPFRAEGPVPDYIAGRRASLVGPEPYTMLANLTWIPAISVPAGLSPAGLPVGLHVHAPWGHDGRLLAAAHRWETHRSWAAPSSQVDRQWSVAVGRMPPRDGSVRDSDAAR